MVQHKILLLIDWLNLPGPGTFEWRSRNVSETAVDVKRDQGDCKLSASLEKEGGDMNDDYIHSDNEVENHNGVLCKKGEFFAVIFHDMSGANYRGLCIPRRLGVGCRKNRNVSSGLIDSLSMQIGHPISK